MKANWPPKHKNEAPHREEQGLKLSLVFPVYADRKSILTTAQDLFSFWTRFPIEIEVIFVADPARNFIGAGLEEELLTLARDSKVSYRVHTNEKHLGRGPSILKGLKLASGELLAVTSLDLAIPLSEVFGALQEFIMNRESSFLLLGNRRGSKKKRREAKSGLRAFFEQVEHDKARGLEVTDPTCPFWMIKRADWERLEIQKLRSWFYTPEVVLAARRRALAIREIEVQSNDHATSEFGWREAFT